MEEERRGAASCQHSKVDCFAALAEMVVIFKVLGVVAAVVDIQSPCRRRKSTANGILDEREARQLGLIGVFLSCLGYAVYSSWSDDVGRCGT